MNDDISTHERNLASWRNANARLEALKQFRDGGGKHRINIGTDNENCVIERILNNLLGERGFAAIIQTAITAGEKEVAEAQREFIKATSPRMVTVGRDGLATVTQ